MSIMSRKHPMPRVLRRRLGWLAAALILPSCASPEPEYYRLLPLPGAMRVARSMRVELRQVTLPRYLDRPEIVRAGASTRLEIQSRERWAEPVDSMVTRTLATELGQRLPAALVLSEKSSTGQDADTLAQTDITRFEADADGRVLLEGSFLVRRLGGRTAVLNQSVAEVVPIEGNGTDAMVRAMSTALSLLADRMAEALINLG